MMLKLLLLPIMLHLLASCGVQGDLYLPDQPAPARPEVRQHEPVLHSEDDLFEGRY